MGLVVVAMASSVVEVMSASSVVMVPSAASFWPTGQVRSGRMKATRKDPVAVDGTVNSPAARVELIVLQQEHRSQPRCPRGVADVRAGQARMPRGAGRGAERGRGILVARLTFPFPPV